MRRLASSRRWVDVMRSVAGRRLASDVGDPVSLCEDGSDPLSLCSCCFGSPEAVQGRKIARTDAEERASGFVSRQETFHKVRALVYFPVKLNHRNPGPVWNVGISQESRRNFTGISTILHEKCRNRDFFPAIQTCPQS